MITTAVMLYLAATGQAEVAWWLWPLTIIFDLTFASKTINVKIKR